MSPLRLLPCALLLPPWSSSTRGWAFAGQFVDELNRRAERGPDRTAEEGDRRTADSSNSKS